MIGRGVIDLHIHGTGRYDTRTGAPETILHIAGLLGRTGTAAFLPTIYPGPIPEMRRHLAAVREAMEQQSANPEGPGEGICPSDDKEEKNIPAVILGVHLEGPFLNPLHCGSLDRKSFVKPGLSSLKKLLAGYEHLVRIMTIAPELPGALRVIEKCSETGIRVNMGHSDASFRQASDAKKAGARGISHVFNAMRPFHHREPGLIGLALLDEDIYIEVIADGHHIHPKTLELVFQTKRLDRIILVSDSVKGSGKKGRPVLSRKGIIAGSGITLADSAPVLRDIGVPEAEIIEASRDNPARYLSLKL